MPKTDVHPDRKDLQAKVVPMVPMANLAVLVNQACPATTRQYLWMKKANAAGAHPAHLDHPAHPAQLDPPVSKVILVYLANQPKTDLKDHQAHPDHREKKAKMVHLAKKANQEKTPNVEIKDRQVHQAKSVNPALLDPPEKKDLQANQETKPTMAHPDHLVKEENLETKDPLVQLVQKAPPARMLTIVHVPDVPPRLPLPRPSRKLKKPNDYRTRSIFTIEYRIHYFGLTGAFNFLNDYRKFFNPVLRFFLIIPIHASKCN